MLREETVESETLELLKKMVLLPELKPFRLVGGTALSLLYGHGKSIDLDLFTDQPLDKTNFIAALERVFGRVIPTDERYANIYQCNIQNVKVDFVPVPDPFLNPIQILDQIPFADTEDLIALKLNAVRVGAQKKTLGFSQASPDLFNEKNIPVLSRAVHLRRFFSITQVGHLFYRCRK